MTAAAALPVRPGVQWEPGATDRYFSPTNANPTAADCNSTLIEVVGMADQLCAGTALMNADRTGYTLPTYDGTTPAQVEVGRWLSSTDLTGTDERTTTALALAQVAADIHAGTTGGTPARGLERPAGITFLHVAAGVAVVALVGLAIDWYCTERSTAAADGRTTAQGIVEGARLQLERMREIARTGQHIAPGPIELAAGDAIRAAATRARAAGIGQQVTEAAQGITKAAFAIGALVVLVMLANTTKRG